jgi:hypothetical protein
MAMQEASRPTAAATNGVWREMDYEGKPDNLSIRMRFGPTGDGVAVAGIMVERTDGRAVTAQDLRRVKLPPNWMLFGETAVRWYQPTGAHVARHTKARDADGTRRDRWVWDLWNQALIVAPRAPVLWMLPQMGGISEATARRWIKRARKRAVELGWPAPALAVVDA